MSWRDTTNKHTTIKTTNSNNYNYEDYKSLGFFTERFNNLSYSVTNAGAWITIHLKKTAYYA